MSAALTDHLPTDPTGPAADRPPAAHPTREGGRVAGPEPRAVPGSRAVGVVLALLVTALGVFAGREALAAWGAVPGGSWLTGAADAVGAVGPQWWVLPAGAALALVGLALLLAALRPRRRRHLTLGADGRVWLHADDLARLVRTSVRDLPGVLDARTSGSRRTLRVDVTTTASGTAPVQQQVSERVRALVGDVQPQPRVRVRVRTGGAR